MTRKEKYAEYARHCLELGEQRSLPGERLNLLQMAQGWRRLAEQADEANAILAEGRDLGVISQKAG